MKVFTVAKTLCLFALIGTMSVANAQFGNLLKDLEKAAKDLEKGIQQGGNPGQEQKPLSPNPVQSNTQQDSSQVNPPSSKGIDKNLLDELGVVNKTWSLNQSTECNDGRVDGPIKKNLQMELVKFTLDDSSLRMEYVSTKNGSMSPATKVLLLNNIEKNVAGYTTYALSGVGKRNDSEISVKVYIRKEKEGLRITGEQWGNYQENGPGRLFECSAEQLVALGRSDDKVASDPRTKGRALQSKYFSFLVVQDCYEVRKSYKLKYVDPETFNRVKKAMKTIENHAKSEIKGLDTDATWKAATKQYSESLVAQLLDVNKSVPQDYSNDNQRTCNVMVKDLLDSLPKEAPKKSF